MSVRIARLDFKPWGCFEDLTLSFSSEPGVVELVHGSNATGKSTTSRGERSLLYGIESRTVDGHTHDYADLRIGGLLVLDGRPVELLRRKGRTGTLRGPDDRPVADDTIALALGGLGEDVYRGLFHITHQSLVQGAAELLQGRGEVGASLFAAASGIAAMHDTLARLDAEATRIFKPRGRSDPLHSALTGLSAAQKTLRAATLRPARHRDMERALEAAQRAADEFANEVRALELRSRALARMRAVAPLLDRHAELTEALAALAEVPELEPDAATRRAGVESRLVSGEEERQRKRELEGRLSAAVQGVRIDDGMLTRGEEIAAVAEQVAVVRKAVEDRRKREAELGQARADLHRAAATVGVEPVRVPALRRPQSARRALDTSLRRHPQLVERERLACEQVDTATVLLEQEKEALSEATDVPDTAALAAAVRAGRRLGPVSTRTSDAETESRRLRAEAEAAFARLTPRPSSLEALATSPAPGPETVERAVAEHADLERAAAALSSERERLKRETADAAEEREALELAGGAPTADDIRAARACRSDRWTPLRAALAAGTPAPAGAPERFELAITQTDSVADAAIAGAGRIERAAHVEARARRLERDEEAFARQTSELASDREALERRWLGMWTAAGTSAPAIPEAQRWLGSRDEVLTALRGAATAEAEAAAARTQASAAADAVRARLETAGLATPTDVGLEELLELAEAHAAESDLVRRERAELEARDEAPHVRGQGEAA